MLPILAYLLAAAAAAPSTYDQRQDGDLNLRADVQNVVVLVAIPEKLPVPLNIMEGLIKFRQNGREVAQDRADVQAMEAFVEPSTPYRVEIGTEGSERSAAVDGSARGVEVLIAGRRRSDPDQAEAQPERDELKLLGATEQCGPEYERDPITLTCRPRPRTAPEKTPEVVPATS